MAAPRGGGSRTVVVEGLDELLRKLTPELYEPAGKAALTEIGASAANAARAGAPRLSGKLAGSITPKTNPGPQPRWAAVRVGAVSSRGYGYPKLLEFSPKHGHRDWLKSAVTRAQGSFAAAVDKAARAVEGKWRG
jgi:hypothetical protein